LQHLHFFVKNNHIVFQIFGKNQNIEKHIVRGGDVILPKVSLTVLALKIESLKKLQHFSKIRQKLKYWKAHSSGRRRNIAESLELNI